MRFTDPPYLLRSSYYVDVHTVRFKKDATPEADWESHFDDRARVLDRTGVFNFDVRRHQTNESNPKLIMNTG